MEKMSARDACEAVANILDLQGDGRSVSLARTLREIGGWLGDQFTGFDVGRGFYLSQNAPAETPPEIARTVTCKELYELFCSVLCKETEWVDGEMYYKVWKKISEACCEAAKYTDDNSRGRYLTMASTYTRELNYMASLSSEQVK